MLLSSRFSSSRNPLWYSTFWTSSSSVRLPNSPLMWTSSFSHTMNRLDQCVPLCRKASG
ncbi:Uncharacterised protein [Mycobacterium tuberculosis]|nr:Uncharacterised protein [Mycobacterium tuberculosis]